MQPLDVLGGQSRLTIVNESEIVNWRLLEGSMLDMLRREMVRIVAKMAFPEPRGRKIQQGLTCQGGEAAENVSDGSVVISAQSREDTALCAGTADPEQSSPSSSSPSMMERCALLSEGDQQ